MSNLFPQTHTLCPPRRPVTPEVRLPTLHRSFPRLPPAALLLCSVLSAPAAHAQSAPAAAVPTGEFEQPYGEWNLLELVEEGKVIHQYVNGHLANVGTDLFPVTAEVAGSSPVVPAINPIE